MSVDESVHDVCADPLTPQWRLRVEHVSRGVPAIPAGHRRGSELPQDTGRQRAYAPRPNRGGNTFVKGRELFFRNLWNAGVPKRKLTELGFGEEPYQAAEHLRRLGLWLAPRHLPWSPPDDWEQRLDELLDSDG